MAKRLFGEEHPRVAISIYNLANVYESQGRYTEAESLLRQALEMNQRLLGEQHPIIATNLNQLANVYESQGRYTEAESLIRQALELRKRLFGEEHPDVATSLHSLALVYKIQGKYDEAEPLYHQALEMYKHMLGEKHPYVATSMSSLALLYYDRGQYEEAESLFRQALDIEKSQLGKQHPNVATTLNDLALLYTRQGKYTEAEPLFHQALEIRKKLFGEQHPQVATSINNLALFYYHQEKYAEAETLYRQALEIRKKLFEKPHPEIANSFNNLAVLYYRQGNYAEAEIFWRETLTMEKRLLGKQYPNIANSFIHLGLLYWSQDKINLAWEFLQQGVNIEEQNISRLLAVGSERQKRDYIATKAFTAHVVPSLHLQGTPNDADAARIALTTVLRRKGRILDAVTNNLQTLRLHLTPEDRELLDQLADTRSQLATLLFQGIGNRSPEVYRQLIADLKTKANELEYTLSYRSNEFRRETQPVTIAAVQQKIPDNAILLEFIRYKPFNSQSRTMEEPRYAVYLLDSRGELQWMDLGNAEPIDAAVAEFRQALQFQQSHIQTVAHRLYEQLMQPIRSVLDGEEHLLISPESQLNLIPFAALVDEDNRYLVQDYQITYLNSGRDLLKRVPSSNAPPVLVANPDYDDGENIDIATRRGSRDLANLRFGSLPGTAAEAEAIAPLFPKITILTESNATEQALKQISAPQILHIATHGFFLEDVELVASPNFRYNRSLWVTPDPNAIAVVNAENPLLRSGLALAGFNNRRSGSEDGVLTALEVAGLDLYGTQLVVLSACDTGVGEVNNGEGVYGLRRALAMAGAQSQLISLWKVSDKGTMELMVRYYQRLLSNQGRSEAYRQTQLEMLENSQYQHPYFWAAFIPSGDWRPLDSRVRTRELLFSK
jgi:CHAT domain-containing protein